MATVDNGPFVVALSIEMKADDSPFPFPPDSRDKRSETNAGYAAEHLQHSEAYEDVHESDKPEQQLSASIGHIGQCSGGGGAL